VAEAAPLQFSGLNNEGRKFISPHLRVGMTIYPLWTPKPFRFAGERSSAARRIDWYPDQTEASILSFQWSKQMGQPSGQWTAVIKAKTQGYGTLLHQVTQSTMNFDDQAVVDGDWVDIAVLRNGIRIPLCRGVIDSVRKSTISAGGATVVTYTLTGRDHGAFFEYPITWNSIWARTLNETVSGLFTERVKGRVGGRPDELFKALIDGTFQGAVTAGVPSGQWKLPPSLFDRLGQSSARLHDILKIVSFSAIKGETGLRGAYYNEPQLWTVGEQSLHQTLSQWVNPVLNEWWYDLLPPRNFMPPHGLDGFLDVAPVTVVEPLTDPALIEESQAAFQASLVPRTVSPGYKQTLTSENEQFGTIAAIIRERPFPTLAQGRNAMWYGLPTWYVPTWLIQNSDLGRGGQERFNLFELLADFGLGSQSEQATVARPMWHREDIEQHGLRSYSQSVRFFAQDGKGIGDWLDERNRWLNILRDWFAPNPYLRQGHVTVKTMLPEIRIGQRLILDHDDPKQQEQFYIEGVNLQYQAPSQGAGATGSTTLVLTRGFRGQDQDLISATSEISDVYKDVF
jgi:hypothetical protein